MITQQTEETEEAPKTFEEVEAESKEELNEEVNMLFREVVYGE